MISTTEPRSDYIGNGTTNEYDYDFKIFDETHLQVLISVDGDETELVLNVDYEVTGVGDSTGGSITLLDASQAWIDLDGFLDDDAILAIISNVPLTQTTDLSNQSDYYPEDIEEALDKSVMMHQQLESRINRVLKAPDSEDVASLEIPAADDRASKFLAFDADGIPIASAGSISDAIPVSAFMETVLDDADASSVQTTLGISTFIKTLLNDTSAAIARATLGFVDGLVQLADMAPNSIDSDSYVDGSIDKVHLSDTALYLDVITNPTSPYTVLGPDKLIKMDATAGAKTINLPALASHAGRILRIVKTDSSFNAVTIDGNSAELVGTAATITLNTQGEEVTLFGTATHWVVQRYIPKVRTSFTPTGSWSSNTAYNGFWERDGGLMNMTIRVACSGAPTSASLTLDLPTGMPVIDTAQLSSTQAGVTPIRGAVTVRDASPAEVYTGFVKYNSTSTVAIFKDDGDGTQSTVNATAPITFANSDFVYVEVMGLPITGWGG